MKKTHALEMGHEETQCLRWTTSVCHNPGEGVSRAQRLNLTPFQTDM